MAGYTIKVTLEGTHPPVWRRLAIPEKICFSDLHRMLQVAFGWFDMHLHDFTFSDCGECVADPEVSDDEDIFPEEEALVDDFLCSNRWIRYTYDFGDDWKHKIVLEKEDPSYGYRYATVLKAKGENFEEDSGGIWGGEQSKEPYCIQEVNQVLAQMECPVAKPSYAVSRTYAGGREDLSDFDRRDADSMADAEEMEEALHLLQQLYDMARKEVEYGRVTPPSSSPLGKMQSSWNQFCIDRDSWFDFIEEEEENSLRGCDDMLEGEGYFTEKTLTDKPCRDILKKASRKELQDYCRYIQLPWKASWTKDKLVDVLLQCFQEHPEYVLYVLDEEMLAALAEFCKAPEGAIEGLEDGGACITRAVALGMAEVHVKETAISQTACVEFSREAQEFLLGLEKQDWTAFYQRLSKLDEDICRFILCYGLLEVEQFYPMFCEACDIEITEEEFRRVLYWHCRFCCLIQSGVMAENGEAYVGGVELDLEQVMRDRKIYASGLEYPRFGIEQLAERCDSIIAIAPGWRFCQEYLQDICGLEEDMAKEWIQMTHNSIWNGDSVTRQREELLELYEPSNLMEWTELWITTMEICMDTGLPMLKGYSRQEYMALTGTPATELGLFEEEFEETVGEETHLIEFPAGLQCQLYAATRKKGEGGYIDGVKDILRKTRGNYEVAFLLMNGYMAEQKFSKVKNILLDLRKRLPERDASVEEALKVLKKVEKARKGEGEWLPFILDGMEEEAQKTYRREEPKIGRNDPCPCGSGKKYKNCCGKNK